MGKSKLLILGDLHYEYKDHKIYKTIQKQIFSHRPEFLVSLGDLGGYSHCGSKKSFEEGHEFFSDFKVPFYTLLGNHDLEGREFSTDAENIAAWQKVFGYVRPYFSFDLGGTLGICLSTTRFRENPNCWHEVHLDEPQISWFKETLRENRDRLTFVFSHVPILGSGLRTIQNIHFRFGNAYLNHMDNPQQFYAILRENPQIKLWFSGHNHLGQDYPDSISADEHCSFVHVGVIGRVSRDGRFQSRIIDFDEKGYELYTLDHMGGDLRLNQKCEYQDDLVEQFPLPSPPDPMGLFPPPPFPGKGGDLVMEKSVFLVTGESLIEYDKDLEAPRGLVIDRLNGRTPMIKGETLMLIEEGAEDEVIFPLEDGYYTRSFWHPPTSGQSS